MSGGGQRRSVWALLITDGTTVEFPAEIYTAHATAMREAERWAWTLAGGGEIRVLRPFTGRWEVGVRDVRLVRCPVTSFDVSADWWVGVHWTGDGYPDPEAILFRGRDSARDWVRTDPLGEMPRSTGEDEWRVEAEFGEGDDRSFSVALLAKIIGFARTTPRSTYEVALIGTFVQSIRGEIAGPSGLEQPAIEELIEEAWAELSSETHVLLESSWELESYEEIPAGPMRP